MKTHLMQYVIVVALVGASVVVYVQFDKSWQSLPNMEHNKLYSYVYRKHINRYTTIIMSLVLPSNTSHLVDNYRIWFNGKTKIIWFTDDLDCYHSSKHLDSLFESRQLRDTKRVKVFVEWDR